MKIFSPLYARAMRWARHPRAPWYLATVAVAEASFFPIPPDVMLVPMCLAQPQRALRFATLATLASVFGGMLGYLIGVFAWDLVEPAIRGTGYYVKYLEVRHWFDQWGALAIVIAGFSPIPYKVFTITAGVMGMSVPPFLLASCVGRGGRFYLVALLMAWGGEKMEAKLHQWVDVLGWLTLLLVLIIVAIYQL